MQQRKWWRRRVKRLARQMQHHGAIFTHAIQHHRLVRFGDNLPHNMDGFSLKALKMSQGFSHSLFLFL
jgi:hypothetical protein